MTALVLRTNKRSMRPAMTFPEERLRVVAELENSHFWFVGRRRLVQEALTRHVSAGARVLDIGCGTGNLLRWLVSCGYRAFGLDALEAATLGARSVQPAHVVRASAEQLPIRDGCFDVVTLLDVMEHVDDRSLTGQVRDVLVPGGLMLATVPAFPWLTSFRDRAAGHRRRYDRARLVETLEAGRLELVEMRYYQCLLFPVLVASRLLGRRSGGTRELEDRPGRIVNGILHLVTTLELMVGRRLSMPWGSTIFAVARRPRR